MVFIPDRPTLNVSFLSFCCSPIVLPLQREIPDIRLCTKTQFFTPVYGYHSSVDTNFMAYTCINCKLESFWEV